VESGRVVDVHDVDVMACSLLSLWRASHLARRHPEVLAHFARASKDAGLAFFVPIILRGSQVLAPQDDGGICLTPASYRTAPSGRCRAPERPVPDRVGALKNPVLPRRQPREDFSIPWFSGRRSANGFHAGRLSGEKAGALLEKHPSWSQSMSSSAKVTRPTPRPLPHRAARRSFAAPVQIGRIGLKARLQAGEGRGSSDRARIHRRKLDPGGLRCRLHRAVSACRSGRGNTSSASVPAKRSRARPASPACAR